MSKKQIIKLHDQSFEPYIDRAKITKQVERLALEVAADFKDEVPVFVGVLNGAFMFVADFLKAYPHPCEVCFVKLSSYQGLTSTGVVKNLLDVPTNVGGRSVIILEDIIDTGRTLQELLHIFSNINIKEFRIATMFYKPDVYDGEYRIDYVGMEIPNHFIVGYGLDYKEMGRNLPEVYRIKEKKMLNLIVFGKPGTGKGTQAELLEDIYGLVHISTGVIFRKNIKNDTPLGKQAKAFMDRGDLVPDEVTINMLKSEVEQNSEASGFIFDGFPRTIKQAKSLDRLLESQSASIDATLALEVDEQELVNRLLQRGKQTGRSDDADESKIRNRFKEYDQKTAPLTAYYEKQNKLHRINGIGTVEEITARLNTIIKQL